MVHNIVKSKEFEAHFPLIQIDLLLHGEHCGCTGVLHLLKDVDFKVTGLPDLLQVLFEVCEGQLVALLEGAVIWSILLDGVVSEVDELIIKLVCI